MLNYNEKLTHYCKECGDSLALWSDFMQKLLLPDIPVQEAFFFNLRQL
jgi:hypothetical protein